MNHRNVGPGFLCFVAWLSLYGCAGVSRVETLPANDGVLARYHASIDEVAEIVPQALDAVGQSEVRRSRPDSSSLVLLGSRGFNLWDMGHVSRTRATVRDGGGSEVRVVTRPRDLFTVWPATSYSLRVISEMDRLLGPGAIALTAGDRVRGVDAAGDRSAGTLIAGQLGGLFLARGDGQSERLPLDSFTQLEVFRGSYRQTQKGLAIGVGVGVLAWLAALGACLDLNNPSTSGFCNSPAIYGAPVIGGVVGGLLGTAFKASVWSSVGN